jgi:hypothetical protein
LDFPAETNNTNEFGKHKCHVTSLVYVERNMWSTESAQSP